MRTVQIKIACTKGGRKSKTEWGTQIDAKTGKYRELKIEAYIYICFDFELSVYLYIYICFDFELSV